MAVHVLRSVTSYLAKLTLTFRDLVAWQRGRPATCQQRAYPGCSVLDSSSNGHIEINELIAAVGNALPQCGGIQPACEGGEVDRALCHLAKGNLRAANGLLSQAVQSDPNDNRANLYYATR